MGGLALRVRGRVADQLALCRGATATFPWLCRRDRRWSPVARGELAGAGGEAPGVRRSRGGGEPERVRKNGFWDMRDLSLNEAPGEGAGVWRREAVQKRRP